MSFDAIELCAGGGGQALGLEMAGFHHVAAVEYEPHYCTTLRTNRPHWKVVEDDIRNFRSQDYTGIDLIAGGVPCPPFSIAGKQLGGDDERDMFPAALKIIETIRPRAVLLEDVPGLASAKFKDYRDALMSKL
jgi:DNA (cytosine-5)-methyltransferase 1